ncbi:MAG TPA: SCO family protein [Candidatus Limnocylindrales bacterium]|nr:SCO family protein [Candidatus Limnocylindrales bacterium]
MNTAGPILLLVIAGILLVVVGAVWAGRIVATRTVAPEAAPTLAGEAVMSPNSTPAPPFTLHDQDGKAVSIQDFKGQVVAVSFLDSHCQQQCPLQGEQLGIAMRTLGPATRFVNLVVSVAPATDTPDSERAFATTHRWTGEWHWLSGSPAELAAVWKAYGIEVLPGPMGNIPHSIALYLVDRQGYERVGFLFTDPKRIEEDVRLLSHS